MSYTSMVSRETDRFFRRIDWSAFWTATLISFGVYCFTAAPSVTLEDAGELVVAGDYLGVPHPPGYPIWTICAWVFARLFSFVTFRGQPNPAWAISVMSGFFGALAAGITAMLITRTGSDMLDHMEGQRADGEPGAKSVRRNDRLSWIGGVAGSLVFAFSPVMWSQSTIPEVYTLNAFFLAWIFLLSYRWMRRPSDRILWLTAFVFGLGLTNYQVLLLAAVPLMIVVFLKDIALFRDFLLTSLPFVITLGILKIAAMPSQPGFAKHAPPQAYEGMVGPPLVHPAWYGFIVLAVALAVAGCIGLALAERAGAARSSKHASGSRLTSAVLLGAGVLLLLLLLALLPEAQALPPVPDQPVFSWTRPVLLFLVLLLALWAFAWFAPGGRWFAASITVIEVALAGLLVKGALLGLTHPLTWWFWTYVALNFVVLGLSWVLLPNGRNVALSFLFAQAGVAFYLHMPIASDRNPPMNWGYARTWEGFKHAITRGQYERISPTNVFSPLFIRQIGSYFTDLRTQFTLVLAPLGFLPFTLWQFRVRRHTLRAFVLASVCVGFVALFATIGRFWPSALMGLPRLDKVVVAIVLLFAGVGGLGLATGQAVGLADIGRDRDRSMSDRVTSLLCLSGGLLFAGVFGVGICNAIAETVLEGFGILEPAADADAGTLRSYAMIVTLMTTLAVALIGSACAALIVVSRRRLGDFRLNLDDTAQQWLIATVLGFLMMSLLLIALANPTGDLQDSFIQKVKFVSSHGLFAIWIGYGLIFGLAAVDHLMRRRSIPVLAWIAPAIALATPLIPIHENYFNDHLVDEMSAANQDGHDFGWQFGNYQLRGVEAILEELDPDEEPPPNPDYPPPMSTNAVFFGGTDPGRFVPTYMIYSARVRPDVFLITQNALADQTYMNTMRDLYGDLIWMPMPKDNGLAFQQYVDEVERGIRPNHGDIHIQGGRVQVTGALAVMEINGILTEMLFRKNRDRHDFYVEESYTIRWMFPYLTPHGLILKINRDQTPLTPQHVKDDMDFWDWYSRRLHADWRYPRDVVARKSFSKLRGAIAGLYAARGMHAQAERAFREALGLYRVSPEANLRFVQEVLMPFRRFDESLFLLERLQEADPNNQRLPVILEHVRSAQSVSRRLNDLNERRRTPPGLTFEETLELAGCYLKLGRPDAVSGVLEPLAEGPGVSDRQRIEIARMYVSGKRYAEASAVLARIPEPTLEAMASSPEELLGLASVHASAGQYDAVIRILVIHLRRQPSDWQAWLDLATMNLRLKRGDNAAGALQQGLRIGGQRALQRIQESPDLQSFYSHLLQQGERVRGPGR